MDPFTFESIKSIFLLESTRSIMICIAEKYYINVDNHKSFSINLSEGLFSNGFLNTHIKLTGKTDTRAVNLTQNVGIFLVFVPLQYEICSPNQWHFFFLQSILNQVNFCQEEINQNLPFLRLVVCVYGTREKSGREGIGTICRFFMHNENWFCSNHQNSDFSFFNSG